MKDKNGYLLVEKEFTLRGYKFKFIKQLKNDWCIYEKIKKEEAGVKTRNKHIHKKYELVKLRRQESYVFNDKKIEAKWLYPSDNAFGKLGFDCISLDAAQNRYEEIVKAGEKKEVEEEIKNEEVRIPTKDFTIKEFIKANPKLNYSIAYQKIKELISNKEIRLNGERKNKRGKASNLYKKV